MTERYIIDAHAWISYLEGGIDGEKVNLILNEEAEFYVLPITIAEVIGKVRKQNHNVGVAYKAIISKCQVIESTPRAAKEAGILYAECRKEMPSFGIVDSLLISTARSIGAKVITGDMHFKIFKEAKII